jgi:hypothetical protein
MTPPDTNGWSRSERLVMHKLDELTEEVRGLRVDIQKTKVDVAILQVKAGVFGLVGGLLPFGLFVAYQIVGSGN